MEPARRRSRATGHHGGVRDDIAILGMTPEDWRQVEAIYAAGIDAGHATFESVVPTWESFDSSRLPDHRLVGVHASGAVTGWPPARRCPADPCTPG